MLDLEEISMNNPNDNSKIFYNLGLIVKKAKYIEVKPVFNGKDELLEQLFVDITDKVKDKEGFQGNTLMILANTSYSYEVIYLEDLSKKQTDNELNELATISRHDLVNGQKVIYSPIKNLTDLYLQYNPNNIIMLQSSDSYFKSLSFSIFDRLPECGTGYTISPPITNLNETDKTKWTKTPNCKAVYIDPITGDLVINLINTRKDEQLEVQVLSSGDVFSDTIHNGGN